MIHHIPESSRFMRKISMRSKKLNELGPLRQIEGFTNSFTTSIGSCKVAFRFVITDS